MKKVLIIVMTVLLVVLLVEAAAVAFMWYRPNQTEKPGTNSGISAEQPDAGANTPETGAQQPGIPEDAWSVTFYSSDGTVLKIEAVEKNGAAVPPKAPEMAPGLVFQAWDQDFTKVTQDMHIYPVCEDLHGKPNGFAVGSAYGSQGDTVNIPVLLAGDVCTAGFDMILTYDPEKLALEGISGDDAVVYNTETPGTIRLNYVSIENTMGELDICNLAFTVLAESGSIPVTAEVVSIYACADTVDSGSDELYVPQHSVVDGAVHVIP